MSLLFMFHFILLFPSAFYGSKITTTAKKEKKGKKAAKKHSK